MNVLFKELATKAKDHFNRAITAEKFSLYSSLNFKHSTPLCTKESYHALHSNKGGNLFFIDGGNGVLFSHTSFHLEFQKIAISYYQDQKRIFLIEIPYYLLLEYDTPEKWISSFEFEECIIHCSSHFDKKLFFPHINLVVKKFFDSLCFDDLFNILSISQETLPDIANELRRILEFECLAFFEKKYFLNNTFFDRSTFVFDGSLFEYLPLLLQYESSIQNGKRSLIGVAKSNTLLSKEGSTIHSLCHFHFPMDKLWYSSSLLLADYNHIIMGHFHEKALSLFRIDVMTSQKLDDVLSLLVPYANDPIFLGYPYPLIEIDQFARVSLNELNVLKQQLFFIFEKEGIDSSLFAHAHDILDHIKF